MAVILYVIMVSEARQWLRRPHLYLAAGLVILLFSPVILWNAQHDWISFTFQGPRRVSGGFDFDLPDLIGCALLLLTPVGFLTFLSALFMGRKQSPETKGMGPELLRAHRLFLFLTLVPLSVFVFFSLFRNTKLNWTGPLWLGMVPFMAHVMVSYLPAGAGRYVRLHGASAFSGRGS